MKLRQQETKIETLTSESYKKKERDKKKERNIERNWKKREGIIRDEKERERERERERK